MGIRISIHAPRVGSDGGLETAFHTQFLFQSTLPVWGATTMALTEAQKRAFQSTLPVWGATSHCGPFCCQFYYFNPRSPCGERHLFIVYKLTYKHFNPRSPCGERLRGAVHSFSAYPISIHAPRVGSDPTGGDVRGIPGPFQSTLPVWGATTSSVFIAFSSSISIHAPRVGSDSGGQGKRPQPHILISIHAPRVGSDWSAWARELAELQEFQSTLPVWGATRS